jgi:hypothetical protein
MENGRGYDVPEQKRTSVGWIVALVVIAFFLIFSPILGLFVMLWEKATVKEFFIAPIASVESPDKKQHFAASREGVLQLVETKTGKVLKTAKLSPIRYTGLEVKWAKPQKIEIFASFRYAGLARGDELQWDLVSSKLQELHPDGSLTEPETE